MRKVLLAVALTVFFLRVMPVHPIRAEGEFTADYDVSYVAHESGVTSVTQRVTLTNRQTNIYPKQYSIILDTANVRSVTANDPGGNILPVVTTTDDKTQIMLTFNQQVVGLGKKLVFTLRYENLDVAQKHGTIWEINIPGIADTKDLGSYDVSLSVPDSFGPIAYMSPPPHDGSRWNKLQMTAGGISAAYGESQFFALDLNYYLDNPQSSVKKSEIALPPDTAYQKVSIVSIDPEPAGVVRDNDGNWLAQYEIPANSTLQIKAKVTVSISLTPRSDYKYDSVPGDEYLLATPNWQTNDPRIRDLAVRYKTPRAIYDYVVKYLSYDYERVNNNPVRKGAVKAITDPAHSVCMEFTDLFIAIARAAGIPARQNIGYAYTTNTKLRPLSLVTDILHAWPEYYDSDKGVWVPVDPTWANTTGGVDYFSKLDFNHIVFAINGLKDDYPYPAGSYRQTGRSGKTLDIQFADSANAKHLPGKLDVQIVFPDAILAGLVSNGVVRIRNSHGVALDNVSVSITSSYGNTSVNKTISHIPPYTVTDIPFQFTSGTFFAAGQGIVTALVDGKPVTHTFQIRPLHVIIGGIFFVSVTLTVGLWLILRRHQKITTGLKT